MKPERSVIFLLTEPASNLPLTASSPKHKTMAILHAQAFHPSVEDCLRTLPFKPATTPLVLCDRIRDRWSWFEDARKNDEMRSIGLGTLGYFPFELRQQILTEFIPQLFVGFGAWTSEPIDFGPDQVWLFTRELDGSGASNGVCTPSKVYVPERQKVCDTVTSLRQASKTLRGEFYNAFFATYTMLFDAPVFLAQFFRSPFFVRQAEERGRMSISVTVKLECPQLGHGMETEWHMALQGWQTAFDRLPSHLRCLTIELRFRCCIYETRGLWKSFLHDLDMFLGKIESRTEISKTKIDLTYCRCPHANGRSQVDRDAGIALLNSAKELVENRGRLSIKPRGRYIFNSYTIWDYLQ